MQADGDVVADVGAGGAGGKEGSAVSGSRELPAVASDVAQNGSDNSGHAAVSLTAPGVEGPYGRSRCRCRCRAPTHLPAVVASSLRQWRPPPRSLLDSHCRVVRTPRSVRDGPAITGGLVRINARRAWPKASRRQQRIVWWSKTVSAQRVRMQLRLQEVSPGPHVQVNPERRSLQFNRLC